MKILLVTFLSISILGCTRNQNSEIKPATILQYSTLSALLEGVYDGDLTIGQLKKEGSYGIGTFNALDGELIMANGICYKVKSDSKVSVASDSEKTPFAAVCNFRPDTLIQIQTPKTLKEIEDQIDSIIPSPNLIYAYKISGIFDSIIIRSVPKQDKPYLRLIEAYKKQGIYKFAQSDGILFGYKFPKYLKDVNMDGFHFHFLSNDKNLGGHLLNCRIIKANIEVAYIRHYKLQLPNNEHFNSSKLINKRSELNVIEGGEEKK